MRTGDELCHDGKVATTKLRRGRYVENRVRRHLVTLASRKNGDEISASGRFTGETFREHFGTAGAIPWEAPKG